MVVVDHQRWNFEDSNYGIEDIKVIADHFKSSLAYQKYDHQAVILEFQQLKKLVKAKYRCFMNSSSLWEIIFQQHNEAHPTILLIVEILLVISFSSSNIECGFSTINRIFTTSHVSLGKLHVDDLMTIRIIVPILASLDPNCKEKLVQKATKIYLEKKRYHTKPKSVRKTVPESSVLATEDLFLQKKKPKTEVNALLEDENYLVISESENDDKVDEGSKDNETESDNEM